MEGKNKYTFLPLPSITGDPLTRQNFSPETGKREAAVVHDPPYDTMPDLECHIAPPFLAINGGPKCASIDLHEITSSRPELKPRLKLLCEIWEIFLNARDDACKWEGSLKRKRKWAQDAEDVERLTQSSQRTTRSKSRKLRVDNDVKGNHKRKAAPSLSGTTLTKRAVLRSSKRQKSSNLYTRIKRWAESID